MRCNEMKRKLFLSLILLCLSALIFVGCSNEKAPEETQQKQKQEQGQENEKKETPKLSGITLSECGDQLKFDPSVFEYTVKIPDGRPKVPQVSATADKGEVDILQAKFPDGQKSSKAKITLKLDGEMSEYFVNFEKSADMGFELQYKDVYTWDKGAGQYTSSKPEVISVDGNGNLKVLATSDEPITINSPAGETLTVSKAIKAQVALFFITGQSNGQGCFDNKPEDRYFIDGPTQLSLVDKPLKEGQVFSIDAYQSNNPYNVTGENTNKLYDMAVLGRMGFAAPLGKTWYEASGEKTIILQAALSGAPIESWLDPKKSQDAGLYGSNQCYNNMKVKVNALNKILENDGNYEITRTYNFWLQGETAMANAYYKKLANYDLSAVKKENPNFNFDKKPLTDKEYYNYFLQVDKQMRDDFGITSNFIILPRATSSVASSESLNLGLMTDLVPVRAAQYSLGNNNDNIAVISRLGDIARCESMLQYKNEEGYGYMGCNNLHYNQKGYNALGVDIGNNLVNNLFFDEKTEQYATTVEVLNSNGRTKFNKGETLNLKPKETHRIAAIALPEYVFEKLTFTTSNKDVATIDEYGMITGVAAGECELTITSESGAVAILSIKVK